MGYDLYPVTWRPGWYHGETEAVARSLLAEATQLLVIWSQP